MSEDFYTWLREVRCTTAREVAERLEILPKSAQERLRRLERRGVLKKKFVNRVAVYCVKEGAQLPPPLTRGPRVETLRRTDQIVDLLTREGCISSSALCKTLGLGYTTVRYITAMLLSQGRTVEVIVGKTAIWCRDRETAEELVAKLREAAHRLASRGRYITPSRLLQMVRRDKEAYGLFTKFIKLSRIDGDHIGPVALAFASSILASLYGDPIRYASHKRVYLVSPHPRQDLGDIAIRDGANSVVTVSLSPDLAAVLKDAERRNASVEEVVVQAVEQLLARFR
jgi:hypothetical protein